MTLTAAVLIIGNEILSGGTQDANVQFLAQRLAARGIKLSEVRIVRDEELAIITAVRALSSDYTYVFSTGGIGPTHDDITAECMAKAFDTKLEINNEARRLLEDFYQKRNVELNEGRLRMARIPVGAELLHTPDSGAPGFKIKNVYVMAGVPRVMQGMFSQFEDTLGEGAPMLSRKVCGNLREGDIALALEKIQHDFPDIEIGSYPHYGQSPSLSLVLRGTEDSRLSQALECVHSLAKSFDATSFVASFCAFMFLINITAFAQGSIACTMDAKACPDGSYVARTGPDCSFAPCPGEAAPIPPSGQGISTPVQIDPTTVGLAQYPDMPLEEDIVSPVNVSFVVEHRSALNGRTVTLQAIIVDDSLQHGDCPKNVRMGRPCIAPRLTIADTNDDSRNKDYDVMALLPGKTGSDYHAGDQITITGLVSGEKSDVSITVTGKEAP